MVGSGVEGARSVRGGEVTAGGRAWVGALLAASVCYDTRRNGDWIPRLLLSRTLSSRLLPESFESSKE